ncbi:MAG TPA: branched-chain amino acid ABC transporter permease [Beijerinckiaceae bacterium]|nr:branched-chain amino acid ABC transporter permease [Beijerinckiaceae bacterium]
MNRIAPLLVLIALAVVPLFIGPFYVDLGSQMLIAAIFALGLNLLVGYAGLTSLGHAAFLGFSAYVCALTSTRLGLNHVEAAALAIGGTTVLAALFGMVALRATGLGFLMITLAMSQVLWGLAYRWESLTNGDNGVTGVTRPHIFGFSLDSARPFYWFTLAVATVSFAFIAMFAASTFGSVLQGTRDQPRRMRALGYNVWLIRWITFTYAGFWGGVAGLLYVYYNEYIHPTALSLTASAEPLLAVIAGGAGTLTGPIVGAALLVFLKIYASTYIERWNMLLGVIFVLIVLLMPDGIVPSVTRLFSARKAKAR